MITKPFEWENRLSSKRLPCTNTWEIIIVVVAAAELTETVPLLRIFQAGDGMLSGFDWR